VSIDKFGLVNQLMERGEIEVARALLRSMDDPKADEWLERIDDSVRHDKPESLGKLVAEIPYRDPPKGFRLSFVMSAGVIMVVIGIGAAGYENVLAAILFITLGSAFVILDFVERAENERLSKLPPVQLRENGLVISKGAITYVLGWGAMRLQVIRAGEKPDKMRIFADSGTLFDFADEIRYKVGFIKRVEEDSARHKLKTLDQLRGLKIDPIAKFGRGEEPDQRVLYVGLMVIAVVSVLFITSLEGIESGKDLLIMLIVTLPASHYLQKIILFWGERRRPYRYQIWSDGIELISKVKERRIDWQRAEDIRVKRREIQLHIKDERPFKIDIGFNYTGLIDGHVVREWTVGEVRPIVVAKWIERLEQGETLKFDKFSMTQNGIEAKTSLSWRAITHLGLEKESLAGAGIVWKDDEWNAIVIEGLTLHFTAGYRSERVASAHALS
jgi:hypothetical protein